MGPVDNFNIQLILATVVEYRHRYSQFLLFIA